MALTANATDASVSFATGRGKTTTRAFAGAVGKKVSLTFEIDGPALVYSFGFR